MSEEDDDFEGGDNQIKKKDEIDVVNEAKAMDLFDNQASHDISNSDSMTVQQKTNFFVSFILIIVVDHQLCSHQHLQLRSITEEA